MTIAVNSTAAAVGTTTAKTTAKTGFGALGSADFIKLMTAQLSQQDPTDPVDNTFAVSAIKVLGHPPA